MAPSGVSGAVFAELTVVGAEPLCGRFSVDVVVDAATNDSAPPRMTLGVRVATSSRGVLERIRLSPSHIDSS